MSVPCAHHTLSVQCFQPLQRLTGPIILFLFVTGIVLAGNTLCTVAPSDFWFKNMVYNANLLILWFKSCNSH